jgi:hypothetical protein
VPSLCIITHDPFRDFPYTRRESSQCLLVLRGEEHVSSLLLEGLGKIAHPLEAIGECFAGPN